MGKIGGLFSPNDPELIEKSLARLMRELIELFDVP
jgi:hypothetical protein